MRRKIETLTKKVFRTCNEGVTMTM